MELKVNPNEKLLTKGLGISEERSHQLFDSAKKWLKDEMMKETEHIDRLVFLQQCASFCENLEEYTLLTIYQEAIIEQAKREVHEEACPRCKARKAAEERREKGEDISNAFGFRSRAGFGGPDVQQIAPGVFMINLSL